MKGYSRLRLNRSTVPPEQYTAFAARLTHPDRESPFGRDVATPQCRSLVATTWRALFDEEEGLFARVDGVTIGARIRSEHFPSHAQAVIALRPSASWTFVVGRMRSSLSHDQATDCNHDLNVGVFTDSAVAAYC